MYNTLIFIGRMKSATSCYSRKCSEKFKIWWYGQFGKAKIDDRILDRKIDNFVDAEISVVKEISTRSHFKSFGKRVCVRAFLGLSSWHNAYMILEDCLFVLLRLFLISWKCSRNLSKSIGLNWGSLSDRLSDLTRGSLIWQKGVWSDKSKERYTMVYIRHPLS